MKTLEEIKDDVAKGKGKASFDYLMYELFMDSEYVSVKQLMDEVAKRYAEEYATECVKASLDKAQYPKDEHGNDLEFGTMYSDHNGREYTLTPSITSPDNIVLV